LAEWLGMGSLVDLVPRAETKEQDIFTKIGKAVLGYGLRHLSRLPYLVFRTRDTSTVAFN
jgi:hypothetical protein